MVSGIEITSAGAHEYRVEVTDGGETTSHQVIVPESMLKGWGIDGVDEEAIVRESFAFLLEREPTSSILPEFSLAVISRYFPEYGDELRDRL